MIITCEIDQFLCVDGIASLDSTTNIVITEYLRQYPIDCKHLPKEIFNMVNIQVINYSTFSRGYYYYMPIPQNHYSCKWNNLVNLRHIYNIRPTFYKKIRDDHICLLNLC